MAKTQDVTIYDEDADNSLKVNTDGSTNTKTILTDGASEVTVTNNKLDVNASSTPALYNQLVHEYQTFSTDSVKINYTVPAGKIFHIVFISVAGRAGTMDIEWIADGHALTAQSISGNNGTPTIDFVFPANSPLGPFLAGEVVTATRVAGDSNKDWSATMTGYLVDV